MLVCQLLIEPCFLIQNESVQKWKKRKKVWLEWTKGRAKILQNSLRKSSKNKNQTFVRSIKISHRFFLRFLHRFFDMYHNMKRLFFYLNRSQNFKWSGSSRDTGHRTFSMIREGRNWKKNTFSFIVFHHFLKSSWI